MAEDVLGDREVAQMGRRTAVAVAADFAALAKPKAMLLVLITALAAMFVAARGAPPLALCLATLAGGSLVSAGANALNCFLDRDIDALMARTARRPLPAGRLRPAAALWYGLGLTASGALVLLMWVNTLAGGLALAANAYYVFGYTALLKRRTEQNIVIGGVAGAAAPLIGYAAVAGHLEAEAFGLAALVLLWTPPHFWSLALLAEADYRRAKVPMLPVARGVVTTRRQIAAYSVLAALAALLPVALGSLGAFYGAAALALGLAMVTLALRLAADPEGRNTRALFRFSVAYLGLICLAMVVDLLFF